MDAREPQVHATYEKGLELDLVVLGLCGGVHDSDQQKGDNRDSQSTCDTFTAKRWYSLLKRRLQQLNEFLDNFPLVFLHTAHQTLVDEGLARHQRYSMAYRNERFDSNPNRSLRGYVPKQ